MKGLRWAALGLTIALAGLSVISQEQSRVGQVKVIKYDTLKEAVLRNRGKVVLIDFWGEFCPPCKAGFPHIVQLHRQYARQGLVVISVSIDDVSQGKS